jgi:regulator of sigma E protease
VIVAAGPLINFLFAVVVFAGFFWAYGEPRTPPVIASVQAGSAAEQAGLRPGDRILSVGGPHGRALRGRRPDGPHPPVRAADVEYVRDGRVASVTAVPRLEVQRDRFGNEFRSGLLGISPADRVIVPLGAAAILPAAIRHTRDVVVMMVDTLGR